MRNLRNSTVIVTGGSSGLGLGIVEALMTREAHVVAVGRDSQRMAELAQRLEGLATYVGEVTDRQLARTLLQEFRPTTVILNAGATPTMAGIHEQSWESFTAVWENDVKATLHWIQEAINQPLTRGSRVLITSSGAAIHGSPLSGGYAGAKRMQWFMANYANSVAAELDRGIRFQVLVPLQIVGETALGHTAASAYARRRGVSVDAFLAGLGTPLTPRLFGEHVVSILSEPQYEGGTAFGIHGDSGIRSLDGSPP